MQIVINGDPRCLNAGLTVAGLVRELGFSEHRIAVEVNREIIMREQYGERTLADGDQVEIVHFVGGG